MIDCVLGFRYSHDIQMCVDSEIYFVFEDVLRSVVAAFSRDPMVARSRL